MLEQPDGGGGGEEIIYQEVMQKEGGVYQNMLADGGEGQEGGGMAYEAPLQSMSKEMRVQGGQ